MSCLVRLDLMTNIANSCNQKQKEVGFYRNCGAASMGVELNDWCYQLS